MSTETDGSEEATPLRQGFVGQGSRGVDPAPPRLRRARESENQEGAVREEGEGGFNVLIVDDEAATRTLLRATVEGLGIPCRIFEAVDGDAALEIARRTRPDLVLLDIVMPGSGTTGVWVCQELCKDRRTKVVIISGKAGEAVIRACLYAGAIEHIAKPFSVPELRAKLEGWLRR